MPRNHACSTYIYISNGLAVSGTKCFAQVEHMDNARSNFRSRLQERCHKTFPTMTWNAVGPAPQPPPPPQQQHGAGTAAAGVQVAMNSNAAAAAAAAAVQQPAPAPQKWSWTFMITLAIVIFFFGWNCHTTWKLFLAATTLLTWIFNAFGQCFEWLVSLIDNPIGPYIAALCPILCMFPLDILFHLIEDKGLRTKIQVFSLALLCVSIVSLWVNFPSFLTAVDHVVCHGAQEDQGKCTRPGPSMTFKKAPSPESIVDENCKVPASHPDSAENLVFCTTSAFNSRGCGKALTLDDASHKWCMTHCTEGFKIVDEYKTSYLKNTVHRHEFYVYAENAMEISTAVCLSFWTICVMVSCSYELKGMQAVPVYMSIHLSWRYLSIWMSLKSMFSLGEIVLRAAALSQKPKQGAFDTIMKWLFNFPNPAKVIENVDCNTLSAAHAAISVYTWFDAWFNGVDATRALGVQNASLGVILTFFGHLFADAVMIEAYKSDFFGGLSSRFLDWIAEKMGYTKTIPRRAFNAPSEEDVARYRSSLQIHAYPWLMRLFKSFMMDVVYEHMQNSPGWQIKNPIVDKCVILVLYVGLCVVTLRQSHWRPLSCGYLIVNYFFLYAITMNMGLAKEDNHNAWREGQALCAKRAIDYMYQNRNRIQECWVLSYWFNYCPDASRTYSWDPTDSE